MGVERAEGWELGRRVGVWQRVGGGCVLLLHKARHSAAQSRSCSLPEENVAFPCLE